MGDDLFDATMYAMLAGKQLGVNISPTGRDLAMSQTRAWGKSQARTKYLQVQANKTYFGQNLSRPRPPSDFELMRGALKALKSPHLIGFIQMSPARKANFIARVIRHGQKKYPDQQHMRDIADVYIAERVYYALKD